MARRKKEEEVLLSFTPRRRGEAEPENWDDFEEEALQEEQVEDVAPIVAEAEEPVYEEVAAPVEEETVEEETPAEEEFVAEETSFEEESIEEDVPEEETFEAEETAFEEESIEEDIAEEEEFAAEETSFEEEVVVEEEPEEETLDEVVLAPQEDVYENDEDEEEDEDDDSYDRTHIFEHAEVYYDDGTVILPRNFESRIRQSSADVKKLYSEIKNVLMEYSGVKCRMTKYVEVFRCGGAVAKIRIKGKSLYLYLKLNPESIDHDYLKVVDRSHRRNYEETPAEIKVTGKRKCKRSIEMIRLMMEALQVGHRRHPENIDYAEMYPYVENAVIKGENMIKVNKRSEYVDVNEVNSYFVNKRIN